MMTRSEFIRKTLLGLVAAAALPATIGFEYPLPKVYKKVVFKVSKEMLADKKAFAQIMEPYKLDAKISSIAVGYEEDDIIKDLMTVLIKYKV
jgi:hypothetical protein